MKFNITIFLVCVMLIISYSDKKMYDVCVVNHTDMNAILYLSNELEENVVMVDSERFETITVFEGAYEWMLKTGSSEIDTCFYLVVDSGLVEIMNNMRLEIDHGEQGIYCVWIEK